MATMRPEDLLGTRPMPGLRTRIDETLPGLAEFQVAEAWKALRTGSPAGRG